MPDFGGFRHAVFGGSKRYFCAAFWGRLLVGDDSWEVQDRRQAAAFTDDTSGPLRPVFTAG